MKRRIEFDNGSQIVDVVGTAEVGMLHLNIYWRDIDEYGNARECLGYSTNYMTPKEAHDLSDLLLEIANEMGVK